MKITLNKRHTIYFISLLLIVSFYSYKINPAKASATIYDYGTIWRVSNMLYAEVLNTSDGKPYSGNIQNSSIMLGISAWDVFTCLGPNDNTAATAPNTKYQYGFYNASGGGKATKDPSTGYYVLNAQCAGNTSNSIHEAWKLTGYSQLLNGQTMSQVFGNGSSVNFNIAVGNGSPVNETDLNPLYLRNPNTPNPPFISGMIVNGGQYGIKYIDANDNIGLSPGTFWTASVMPKQWQITGTYN